MDFEIKDVPAGLRTECGACLTTLTDPAAALWSVALSPAPEHVVSFWMCWSCLMELPSIVHDARNQLANRLEFLEELRAKGATS
jgi:hypothetical protein